MLQQWFLLQYRASKYIPQKHIFYIEWKYISLHPNFFLAAARRAITIVLWEIINITELWARPKNTLFPGIWIFIIKIRPPSNLNIGHGDVIKWKHFPRYWPFVWGIHRSPVNSPHKGQWRGALMFSLICALNKRLSKQSRGWWFETPSCLLWRHCNGIPKLVRQRLYTDTYPVDSNLNGSYNDLSPEFVCQVIRCANADVYYIKLDL